MNVATKISGRCSRCEALPDKIDQVGQLYLWFPLGHTLSKVTAVLQKNKLGYQLLDNGQCLSLNLNQETTQSLIDWFTKTLTTKELADTRVLFMPGQDTPQFQDFSRVTSLTQFIGLVQSNWLLEMIATERVTSYFQPIVQAHNTQEIFGQEALLRGLDPQGNLILPSRIFDAATDAGLLFQLDMLARRSAIREATRAGMQEHLFINFSPTSIYDPATCLRMTVRAIDEAGIPHHRVVFEVIESDQPQDISHLKGILNFYQAAGFLVALDDFGAGYSNLNLIHELRPDFIKLDMNLLRNVHQDSYKGLITQKILEITQELGIRTIAEGIETPEELQWVQQHGATFVQGYLIAKPASLRASVVKELEAVGTPLAS